MAPAAAPTLFVSYSHSDKRVARRLVRRCLAHGVKVWLDERELRLGAALTASIRTHIQNASMLLVIATKASGESPWVGLELDFAKEQGKAIVPLFVEPVSAQERFRDHLGVDATSPQAFEEAVEQFLRDLFLSCSLALPPPDYAVLTQGLRELAKEEPDLAPLIIGCLDSAGLNQSNMDTVYGSAFHPLDYALNALFDVMPNSQTAQHAAYGFYLAGAGTSALLSWITKTGDGDLPLVTAAGGDIRQPAAIAHAIRLLGACDPPNNHALYQFIHYNAAKLNDEQRRATMRLVTWPVRNDSGRLADVLGWVALKQFPNTVEIEQMWSRWVYEGSFDGKPSAPADLAHYLADAHKENLAGWERINETLRSHVRQYLRSRDKNKVVIALDHVKAAAEASAPVLNMLLRETDGVSGTAEWNDWREQDAHTARWMGWYVFEVAKEARGDRDWLRAWEAAKRMTAFEEKRQRILEQRDEGQGDTEGRDGG